MPSPGLRPSFYPCSLFLHTDWSPWYPTILIQCCSQGLDNFTWSMVTSPSRWFSSPCLPRPGNHPCLELFIVGIMACAEIYCSTANVTVLGIIYWVVHCSLRKSPTSHPPQGKERSVALEGVVGSSFWEDIALIPGPVSFEWHTLLGNAHQPRSISSLSLPKYQTRDQRTETLSPLASSQ